MVRSGNCGSADIQARKRRSKGNGSASPAPEWSLSIFGKRPQDGKPQAKDRKPENRRPKTARRRTASKDRKQRPQIKAATNKRPQVSYTRTARNFSLQSGKPRYVVLCTLSLRVFQKCYCCHMQKKCAILR